VQERSRQLGLQAQGRGLQGARSEEVNKGGRGANSGRVADPSDSVSRWGVSSISGGVGPETCLRVRGREKTHEVSNIYRTAKGYME